MSPQIVDTNGWHTVSALSYDDVNAGIVAAGSSPTAFSHAASDGSASVQNGTFGTWSVGSGGSGQDIMLNIPVTGGTVIVGTNSFPVTPCNAKVLITASFLPQPGSSLKNLKPATQTGDVASVESLTPAQSNFLADAALRELLQQWLNDNLQQFNHTFAGVDLNADLSARPGLAWIKPSWIGYAVAEPTPVPGQPAPTNVFAVLALIDGATPPAGLVPQVSPFAIPSGAAAGFLISSDQFLQRMILPAVPYMFKNLPANPSGMFAVLNDGKEINNLVEIAMRTVKLENGNEVSPSVPKQAFSIEIDGIYFKINIDSMTFDYSPGITVDLKYTGTYTVAYDAVKSILTLVDVSHVGGGQVNVSKGLQITEIVIGVASLLLAIVGGVAGFAAKAAGAAVTGARVASLGVVEAVAQGEQGAQVAAQAATVSALRGLISGTVPEVTQTAATLAAIAKVSLIASFATALMPAIAGIMTAVAQGNYQSTPKMRDLTDTAVGKIVLWPPGTGQLNLASAQLNGCLQYGLVHP